MRYRSRMDDRTRERVEAAAFRHLVSHLRERTDVQNIELMELAGFCRNCLASWVAEAAEAEGVSLDKASSRALIYGMPYEEWKDQFQEPR